METPAKKLKEGPDASLQKELSPKSRFKTVVQPETLLSMSKGYMPSNTLKNTEWAMKNF